MSDAVRRALRTLMQLVASGGLTALVDKLVGGMDPAYVAIVMAVWQVAVTFAHNWLEDNTAFPTVLKASSSTLPPGAGYDA